MKFIFKLILIVVILIGCDSYAYNEKTGGQIIVVDNTDDGYLWASIDDIAFKYVFPSTTFDVFSPSKTLRLVYNNDNNSHNSNYSITYSRPRFLSLTDKSTIVTVRGNLTSGSVIDW